MQDQQQATEQTRDPEVGERHVPQDLESRGLTVKAGNLVTYDR